MYKEPTTGSHRSGKLKRVLASVGKIAAVVLVIVGVFGLGIGVGQGGISLGSKGNQNKDLPKDLDYSSVEQLYDTLRQSYDGDLDTTKLLDGLKNGLAEASGDPYTTYLNPKQAKEFADELDGTFSGIGAELGQDEQGNVIIVSPIKGFPAEKAGLRSQDIIVGVDKDSTAGLSIPETVTKIRGPRGTKVTLKVVRPSTKQDLSFTITREEIRVPSVKTEILDGNVGYIQITQFSHDTGELATKAAKDFQQKGVKGVILDMRGNPGGLLDQAIEVASLWVPGGKVITQQKRGTIVTGTGLASGNDLLGSTPTVVLVNEGSASASEIVAGALQDHKLATVFGVKSFGKGSVQDMEELPQGAKLKVTIARWYRPNGQNIDKKGITPDKVIKMTDEDYEKKRDPQKDAALSFLRK